MASAGLTGNETTPFTPKWTWSLGMQYDYHTANDSTLGFRVDGDYRSYDLRRDVQHPVEPDARPVHR